MENKNILITGGAGFIGSNLVDNLCNKNNVIVIDNLSTGSLNNLNDKALFYNKDIRSNLDIIFKNYDIDYIFHLAAFINLRESFNRPIECMDINLNGTINLLNYCKKFNVKKFIFSSTGGAIYSKYGLMPYKESSIEDPLSPYGLSKLFAEKYIIKSGVDYVNLRYSNVYGPKQNSNGEAGVISIFINNILNNKAVNIFGDGFQTRDYIYVNDVVYANILAADCAKNKTYNISTNKETNLLQILDILEKYLGKYKLEYLPANNGELLNSKLSYDLIDNDLYWFPKVNINDGIKLTCDYFK
jgi:UDP-glucose 4-epimerase